MNFETCYRLLVNQTTRTSQTDIDMAMISIINAMNFYKSYKFDFNKGWEQVHLLEGQARINSPSIPSGFPAMRPGAPHGMRRPIVIQVIGIVTSGDVETGLGAFAYQAVDQPPLKQISEREIWDMARGHGDLSTSAPGFPEYYCWLGDGSIRVYPVPHTNLVADFYFIIDAHRPRYFWSSEDNDWSFEQLAVQNNTGANDHWQWEELSPEFTNMWLEHAEPLIRARARFDLYANFYSDAGAAQLALGDVASELRSLNYVAESGVLEYARRVPPRL